MSDDLSTRDGADSKDPEELFFRQVHSSWVTPEGTVAMAAFRPSKKDERKLSVSSSAIFDAESAYKQHTAQGLKSGGSMAITEREVAAAYSALDVREDGSMIPLGSVVRDDNPFEGHSHVDFSDLHRRECKSIAANLSNASNDRGWLYQPHRTGISSES